MAKLFYTLEEAALKLQKSEDEVMNMARSGQLQQLRDKDQVLFRRAAIDQIAGDGDMGSDINLDALDLSAGSGGSSLGLSDSNAGGLDDLRLDDSVAAPAAELGLGLGDDLRMDDLRMDDDLVLDSGPGPIAASGADDSMSLDELTLADDDEPAPAAKPAPTPVARVAPPAPTRAPAASSGGSSMSLADSNADSMMMGSPAGMADNEDSMVLGSGQTQLESVGSGSGLLDISSEESFFGAQMIEESMGGDDAAGIPDNAGDIFEASESPTSEEATPVTAGTVGVTFGAAVMAEAKDPKFSGFTGGAMVVLAVALVAMGWSVTEMMVGNYVDVAQMIAENWMFVLGGGAGAILVCGAIGLGIGKATA